MVPGMGDDGGETDVTAQSEPRLPSIELGIAMDPKGWSPGISMHEPSQLIPQFPNLSQLLLAPSHAPQFQ